MIGESHILTVAAEQFHVLRCVNPDIGVVEGEEKGCTNKYQQHRGVCNKPVLVV